MAEFVSGPAPGPGHVVVPVQTTVCVPTMLALTQLDLPPGTGMTLVSEWCTPAEKRNYAIGGVLTASHLEWAFFCDSDMVPPRDTVMRLLATGCDVVGGLYAGRISGEAGSWVYGVECGYLDRPTSPISPWAVEQLTPVDWVGAGALLVRRAVLERLAPGPWFGPDPDDVNFCAKARRAGFAVHVDGRVPVGHLQLVQVMPGGTVR